MSLKSFLKTTPYLFMFCSETWGFRTYFTSEMNRKVNFIIIIKVHKKIFLFSFLHEMTIFSPNKRYKGMDVGYELTDSFHLLPTPGWSDTLSASQTCFSKI